jgi:predicted amidophosphoribosyltransferase
MMRKLLTPPCTANTSHLPHFMVLVDMGGRACYLEFCPACDAPVTMVDERCPDCGTSLADSVSHSSD